MRVTVHASQPSADCVCAERKAREKDEAQRVWRFSTAAVLDGKLDARISEAAMLRSQIRC